MDNPNPPSANTAATPKSSGKRSSVKSSSHRRSTRSTRVGKSGKKVKLNETTAAIRIQKLIRAFLARQRVKARAKEVWRRVFDPMYKRYFWFDQIHEQSSWKQPKYLTLFNEEDDKAVLTIQRIIRGFIHRMRVRKLANQYYQRFYDAKDNAFYWLDKRTQVTTYQASPWLQRQCIAMPVEDQMLLESQLKIAELERQLAAKEEELKIVRKARYEELEPFVIKDKVKKATSLERSKNMEDWTVDELAAWFVEMKMESYIPALYENRVDGKLFINLNEDEYHDLGIANKFHLRKLELILKAYKVRYAKRRDRQLGREEGEDEDEELMSEYSPSELSAILHEQDRANEAAPESDEGSDDDRSSLDSGEDEEDVLTEEQRLQRIMDSENIHTEMIMKGDGINFPMVGDIVRVRYTVQVAGSDKILMSTKNTLERPWVEFVLGIGQVIKGFDRALPLMSVGERSKHTFSSEYGYGKDGLFPHIPPNTTLIFDVTLLEFRPRSTWVKPLIQELGVTNEKPYIKDLKISLEKAHALGQGHRIAQVLSASLLLNEGVDYQTLKSSLGSTGGGNISANNSIRSP
eukprot:gene1254-1366_t